MLKRENLPVIILSITALFMSIVLVANKVSKLEYTMFPGYKVEYLKMGKEYSTTDRVLGIALFNNGYGVEDDKSYLHVVDLENTYIFELSDKYQKLYLSNDSDLIYAESVNETYLSIDFGKEGYFKVEDVEEVNESSLVDSSSEVLQSNRWSHVTDINEYDTGFAGSYTILFPSSKDSEYWLVDGIVGGN